MTDLQYIYQKERKEFGKQCLFSDKKFLMVSIPSNHDEFNDYILRNPVSEGTQLNRQFALSEVGAKNSRGVVVFIGSRFIVNIGKHGVNDNRK